MTHYRGIIQAQFLGVPCEAWLDLAAGTDAFSEVMDRTIMEAGADREWRMLSWPVDSTGQPRVVATSRAKTFL